MSVALIESVHGEVSPVSGLLCMLCEEDFVLGEKLEDLVCNHLKSMLPLFFFYITNAL